MTILISKTTQESTISRSHKIHFRAWNESILPETYSLLAEDLPLDPSAPGGMTEFRRTLSTSFFFKFFLTVKQQLHAVSYETIYECLKQQILRCDGINYRTEQ